MLRTVVIYKSRRKRIVLAICSNEGAYTPVSAVKICPRTSGTWLCKAESIFGEERLFILAGFTDIRWFHRNTIESWNGNFLKLLLIDHEMRQNSPRYRIKTLQYRPPYSQKRWFAKHISFLAPVYQLRKKCLFEPFTLRYVEAENIGRKQNVKYDILHRP